MRFWMVIVKAYGNWEQLRGSSVMKTVFMEDKSSLEELKYGIQQIINNDA
jgi:hypothetical protein